MDLKGKRIAILAEDNYEDMELWYPLLRLREAGAEVAVIGMPGVEVYHSKHGYPAQVDIVADSVSAHDFDALIVPGGYAPDRMRRHEPMLELVKGVFAQGKVVAFICHAGWVSIFAGVVAVVGRREHRRWWLVLVEGLLGILFGVVALLWPDRAALALLYLIAAWAIATGVLEIVVAVILRRELQGEWLLALGGLASLAFGMIVAFRPTAGALAIIWLIGAHAILFGGLLTVLGFRLRGWRKQAQEVLWDAI